MALLYTTTEAIARRLKGWAQLNQPANAFGVEQIDEELVTQIAAQVEARVNRVLACRFRLPLLGKHLEIASVVEKLTVCELIGQLYAGQTPSESGGYGAMICAQGRAELKELKDALLDGEILLGGETLTSISPVVKTRALPPLPLGEKKRIKW